MSKLRIQKYLSEAGVASRRAVEEMILQGRITVNGSVVAELPCFVEPQDDDIRVDGRRVAKRSAQHVYVLLNKPRGVVCTQNDAQGRPRATDMITGLPGVAAGHRLYCVGGLDVESTGLVLLTNDGDLTRQLTNPRRPAERVYIAEVDGHLDEEAMGRLKAGVYLDGKKTPRAAVKVLGSERGHSVLEIRVSEGRNLNIRRVLANLGHKVRRLKRVAIGPLTDSGLKIGHYRLLRRAEIEALREGGQPRMGRTGHGSRPREK